MRFEETKAFIDHLYQNERKSSHYTFVRFFSQEMTADPGGLSEILLVGEDQLNDSGKLIFNYFESKDFTNELHPGYNKFKWQLQAFVSLQDALKLPFYGGVSEGNMFRTFYFYQESRYLLTEAILSSLNGLHVANKQIMRNFLEFNLLQLYLINVANEQSSHRPLNDYFAKGVIPGSNKLMEKALPGDDFCKPIKKRIQLELKNLSSRFSHAYHPEESPQSRGIFRPEANLDSLFFWVHLSAVLEITLWLYYVNLPMLFFPVDVLKKFGFNPPLNMFVDNSTNFIVRQSVNEQDYAVFSEYASKNSHVDDLMNFYNSQPDLTDEEIWETWEDPKELDDTLEACYAKMVAKIRALTSGIATFSTKEQKDQLPEENVAEHDFLSGFKHWQQVYKKY